MGSNRKLLAGALIVVAVLIVVGAGALLYLNRGSGGGNQPVPTGTTTTTQNPNFKGIFVFSGKNAATYATNPSISGTYLGYYWSQLEPQEGQYNWTVIDQDMKPWVDNNKSVILRVSTAGWKAWQPPYSGHGTPDWVYSKGVQSVTETDGAVLPQYWNPNFLQSLNTFVQAFAARYDGNAHVSAIEIGVGDGGETKLDTRKNPDQLTMWQGIGYSNQVWWNTIQQIVGFYMNAFHKTPLVVMPDNTFIDKSSKGFSEQTVVDYAVSHNLWLQDNGLKANRSLPDTWKKVPIVAEQLDPTAQTGDTLQQDVQAGLQNNATIILVFASDIAKSENQSALQQAAAQVRH